MPLNKEQINLKKVYFTNAFGNSFIDDVSDESNSFVEEVLQGMDRS